jgi:hypothetical protein
MILLSCLPAHDAIKPAKDGRTFPPLVVYPASEAIPAKMKKT